MTLFELVNVIKWPECIPQYRLNSGDKFKSSFVSYAGFSTTIIMHNSVFRDKWLVLPVKDKENE